MKKGFEWLKEEWPVALGILFTGFVFLFLTFLMVDCAGGKTVTVTGTVIAHRYKASWDEDKTDYVSYDAGNGQTLYLPKYYTVHHPEEFYLTVYGPDGPHDYYVSHALYVSYIDGQTIPIYRRIGGYSGSCLATSIHK